MSEKIKILVVGCGHMGASHAKAYDKMDECEIVGLVSRGTESREKLASELSGSPLMFGNFDDALSATSPDAVAISTYTETHAEFAIKAMEAGADVFLEKPLAANIADAEHIVATARNLGRKLVVGYILHHHPSWSRFVEIAQTLGKPLVMRMNLNQQSEGEMWRTHRNLMNVTSPIVDCGVHYVDIMCRMTKANPVRVQAIGGKLSDEIIDGMYNYGQLQVVFDDGSVGWYEAGWGPMMSETAFFVKDVVGPKGSVTIVTPENKTGSSDIDSHTKTNQLKVHFSELNEKGEFAKKDDIIDMAGEPGHQELCDREQRFFINSILNDENLDEHMDSAVNSLRIVLAADESIRTGETIKL
jgi:predicted dehydrogenase